jgi:prefoldin subunit 5
MLGLVAYKAIIGILLVGLVGATATTAYLYQQQNVKVSQASDLNGQVNQLEGQISALNGEISSMNKQIDSLNSQLSQLQTANAQLGGNNSQLISQIAQLQSQISQLQAQVSQLQSQISQLQTQVQDLTARLKLQTSRVIANMVCIYPDCPGPSGGNQVGNLVFVSLGTIDYSGYLRVSWTGARVSFTVQVFDVNVTTPVTTSGVFSIPVSANATGNAWFTGFGCNGIYCSPTTYSMTYWY